MGNANKYASVSQRREELQVKVAVSGKGGVGKTLVAGCLAYCFANIGLKTMAIDADPSPNLALTLGLSQEEARKILPISENKDLIESKTSTGYAGVFRLSFSVDDVTRDYAVDTPFGVKLVVMGTVKSTGSGCMCPANAVVRALLRHLVVERSEAVVLDMEAGVEHMGRGTAQNVDAMLVVADANLKALETAKRISDLASQTRIKHVLLVGNKVENERQKKAIERFAEEHSLKLLGIVPFDSAVVEAEMRGETPLKNKNSVALHAVRDLCEKLVGV